MLPGLLALTLSSVLTNPAGTRDCERNRKKRRRFWLAAVNSALASVSG
jgi:hypothetical protein